MTTTSNSDHSVRIAKALKEAHLRAAVVQIVLALLFKAGFPKLLYGKIAGLLIRWWDRSFRDLQYAQADFWGVDREEFYKFALAYYREQGDKS